MNTFEKNLQNSDKYGNNPDSISFGGEIYYYESKNAIPFAMIIPMNYKMFIGGYGLTHGDGGMEDNMLRYMLSNYSVSYIDSHFISKYSREPLSEKIELNAKLSGVSYEQSYREMKYEPCENGLMLSHFFPWDDSTVNFCGRVYIFDEYNSLVFAFWGHNDDDDDESIAIESFLKEMPQYSNRNICIADGTYPYIPYKQKAKIDIKTDNAEKQQMQAIHNASKEEKQKFFKTWKDTVNKKNAEKLTTKDDVTGEFKSEMPMAQWRALRYVDESKVINEYLTRMANNARSNLNNHESNGRHLSWDKNTIGQTGIVHNRWLIHFTDKNSMKSILANGFKNGVSDLKFRWTQDNDVKREENGLHFAWDLEEFCKHNEFFRGGELERFATPYAVVFQSNGVLAQVDDAFSSSIFEVIFDSKQAHNFFGINTIVNDDSNKIILQILNKNCQVLAKLECDYNNGRYYDEVQKKIYDWFINNNRQYMNEDIQHDFPSKSKYCLGSDKIGEFYRIIDEVINETCNKNYSKEITASELNEMASDGDLSDVFSSFEPHKSLNQLFWVNGKLNSRVRMRLLDIADNFFDSLNVDWVNPKDIIITGSIANYNWSKYSDIDMHIIIDFKDVDEKTNFVKEYFDVKKKIWNEQHESLKIYGFPVEVYVQDSNEEHTSSGIYSLESNKWIKEPEYDDFKSVKLDREGIAEKSKLFIEKIEKLESECKKEKDEEKLDVLSKRVKALFDKIKGMRKESLKNGNEMSFYNIVFKVLRRLGYIGRLVDLKALTYDKINSIK